MTTTKPPAGLPLLDSECDECQGNGVVTDPAWSEWAKAADVAKAEWKATHTGQSWYGSPEGRVIEFAQPENPEIMCAECDGKGRCVTDAGRQLLAFIQQHGRR